MLIWTLILARNFALALIGINKLGGIGWIVAVQNMENIVGDSSAMPDVPVDCWPSCNVKYVLDSTVDTRIPIAFVEQHKELERTARRSRHSPDPKSATDPYGRPLVTTGTAEPPSSSSRKRSEASTIGGSKQNKKQQQSASESLAGDPSSSSKRKRPSAAGENSNHPPLMVVLTTAVEPAISTKLTELAALHPDRLAVAQRFSSAVTHLVVSVDRSGVLKRRTMKYMQALMGAYHQ